LEAAGGLPGSFQGGVLFVLAAGAAYLILEWVGDALKARRPSTALGASGRASASWVLALMIAIGIGLHNFGEGLAIGSAFALGEATLGTLLIVGFALHNTTEGLAIVAPLAKERQKTGLVDLMKLGLIGGVPTIAGAWLGGLVYSPVWSVLFLALGVGAIAQVTLQISRQIGRGEERARGRTLTSTPVLSGLLAGFLVMYVTGMLVG
jgi:zinc transporter ZupT